MNFIKFKLIQLLNIFQLQKLAKMILRFYMLLGEEDLEKYGKLNKKKLILYMQ